MIENVEKEFPIIIENVSRLYLHIGEYDVQFKKILEQKGFHQTPHKEVFSMIEIPHLMEVSLPSGFSIVDGSGFTDYMKGFAHGKAFGYYKGEEPDDDDSMLAFRALRNAPDYDQTLDLVVLDESGNIACFAKLLYNDKKQHGILEPLITLPQYRKLGLARAIIHEGMNRLLQRGAKKLFDGSNQEAYLKIGFKEVYHDEIWYKEEKIEEK